LKVLLVGRQGQVGSELERMLPGVVATDRTTLDLTDADAIRRRVREVKPEVIINAAAYNAVDKAETERELAMAVNATAPGVLCEEAKRLGARMVHYSTDYVFGGEKSTPYVEPDAPRPLGHYARSKLEGERAVIGSGCRHLVLRVSWVYGPRATNFYQVIRRKALAGEPLRMVDDQCSIPTPATFIAEHTIALLATDASGLMHLVPSGEASRYEFAAEVVRRLGSKSKLDRAKTAEFPSPAQRPAYSVMCNGLAAGVLGRALPRWQDVMPLA
jgi:dTDP-4-dehydrorhamnose reductase